MFNDGLIFRGFEIHRTINLFITKATATKALNIDAAISNQTRRVTTIKAKPFPFSKINLALRSWLLRKNFRRIEMNLSPHEHMIDHEHDKQ